MKKILKKIFLWLLLVSGFIVLSGVVLSFLPSPNKKHHNGLTIEEATRQRLEYSGEHNIFTTSDEETLFIRRWNPDTVAAGKEDIAILLYHGVTAHSGAYEMAGVPVSEAGYNVFGLDYRGHGLSGGNRGDTPGKERWIADLAESVKFVKSLGYKRVIVMGHSMGMAAAICAADAVPEEIAGVILLSGAYESKTGDSVDKLSFFQKARIFSSAIFRPSHPVVEYYRDDMLGLNDPLFSYKYTVRFLTMLDVKQLRLPATMDVPVLVAVGDQDEMFEVEKVREFFDQVPQTNKEFLVWKGATHDKISREQWEQIVDWLDRKFPVESDYYR
jgi:alpha-beta hydrolase superfamily lysophospholipase